MNDGSTILIVGGGTGGIVLARRLRSALSESHRIRLVDRGTSFHLGATKTWVMLGKEEPAKVSRSLQRLTPHGIEVILADVQAIDVARRVIKTSAGEFTGDYLVLATGADLNMSAVPGLDAAARSFFSMTEAVRLRDELRSFDGGDIAIAIPRIPFKCPPGPYEAAMLLHSHFRERGMEGRTRIHFYTVEKAPMATAGPEIGKYIVSELEKRSIDFHPSMKLSRVDESSRRLVFEDSTEAPYDLLIAVPPHEAPRAVRESGLTNQAGWVPVDPKTLALASGAEPHRVFAIGDVTTVALPGRFQPEMPLSLPKAGVFAEGQARTVADQIAAHVLGREPGEIFDGKGFCYIETGMGRAMRGDGDFFNLPHPMMVPRSPDEAQYQEKKEWATRWMDTYL